MFASFSNRITIYFAALLVAAMGILFFLWYVGWAQIGLVGARNQRLESAIQLLEVKADLQRSMVVAGIQERRGDVLFIAESDEISNSSHPLARSRLQSQIEKKFTNLQRAHANRFKKIFVVDIKTGSLLASMPAEQPLSVFEDKALLNRVIQSKEHGLIESWMRSNGERTLMIAQQIHTQEKNGQEGELQAILFAILDPKIFFEDEFQIDDISIHHHGTTILFDHAGATLTSFPALDPKQTDYTMNKPDLVGTEGTLKQKNASGEDLIVVYRSIRVSPNQVWTMVNFFPKDKVLFGLLANVNILLVAGFIIMLLSLAMTRLASRKLTRSLQSLADTATLLGSGNLQVRAASLQGEPKEIRILSAAFNEMAEAVENVQSTLAAKVQERSEELARSEARHITLFNATINAVIVLEAQRIVDGNPASIELFGANDRATLMNRNLGELSPHFQPNGEESILAIGEKIQLAQELEHHAFEWRHRRLDNGHCFDAEVLLNRVEFDGRQLIQGTIRDISERKRVEAALHASEERHRTLVEWSPEGINVHRKGKLIYVNASAIRMLGAKSADELIGKPIADIIHPNYRDVMSTRVQSIGDVEGTESHYELKLLKLDGTPMDITAQWTLIDFDGAPAVYAAWHDITERTKNAESQRIAATAFESQEGMFVTDANLNILRTNRSFSQTTGYTADELVGKPPHFLNKDLENDTLFREIMLSINEQGSWQGEVVDKRRNGGQFPAWLNISSVNDESGIITHFVGTFNDITLRKTAEDEIRHLAFYDPLTQLPNRRLLMDRLEQALASGARHKRKGALLFIDLDNFKTLNDTLGHDHGDLLLQQVAQRLTKCMREGDTVARLGGDEFVIMLENLEENLFDAGNQAEVVANKILSELNQVYWLGLNEHHSSPSIGVTLFGDQLETIAEPLKRADLAMYQAKAAGRNTIRFFDPKMQILVSERAELEENLRNAMLNDQFELFYQAQLTDKGELIGAEALIRWNHPTRGMIQPAEFIPLAEETGLISILGYWVIYTATHQLARWATQKEFQHLNISVNVSPSQFHQKNFVEQVLDMIVLSNANARRLKLELTEGFSISNIEDVIHKMTCLKQKGVGFSLDDFGTGYSSLSYLKRLPLDQLKIDQSFVRDILVDPNDAAISKMVIVLAESLGLTVIAEGVETVEQQDFLAKQGCHAYQGYLFSRPLPFEQFERFVKDAYQEAQKCT